MKIGLGQIDVVAGSPEKNIERIERKVVEAKADGCDLICFPEMCVAGYLLGDMWTNIEYCEYLQSWNDKIVLMTLKHKIAIVWGNVLLDNDGKKHNDGLPRRYNAAFCFQNGKPCPGGLIFGKEKGFWRPGVTVKTNLPNYRFFDDKRYFTNTIQLAQDYGISINKDALDDCYAPFEVTDKNGNIIKVGVELCEDLWCEDYTGEYGDVLDPTNILVNAGADVIINCSSSPWTHGKNAARDRRVLYVAKNCVLRDSSGNQPFFSKDTVIFVPFFYVNCVGVQNNGKNFITFDGGSTVYNEKGRPCIFSQQAYKEELISANIYDLPSSQKRKNRDKIHEKYDAIIRGLQGFPEAAGLKEMPNVVIGISGGIDSAVVAVLLRNAFPNIDIEAVNMPSQYNSKETKDVARQIAENINARYRVVPIDQIYNAAKKSLTDSNSDKTLKAEVFGLTDENLQAKIRGTIIQSVLAQSLNGIFVNNGNKVETMLGYATLYGDWGGAIAPIADLTKAEVYQMARYLNYLYYIDDAKMFMPIPEKLIPRNRKYTFNKEQIKPSAELRENQVDPIIIGYHCALVEKLLDYKKARVSTIINEWQEGTLHSYLGVEVEVLEPVRVYNDFIFDLQWVLTTMYSQTFKRVQSVPNIVTSKTAFGYDYRESILPLKESEYIKNIIDKDHKRFEDIYKPLE